MRKVQIYIDNQRVNLFKDEKISVKSTVQDIKNIAKIFTDFSQTFTVPADVINNSILGHYYNNDLGALNANVRLDGRIEIDHTSFREGKIQLEGATVKNGQVESYKISFFGDVVTLKDRFGESKLKDLDYTSIPFTYSGDAVKDSITNTAQLDVRFPLISSGRVWSYDDGVGIDLPAYAVDYEELFPAVSDAKIMELIALRHSVTFEGSFLSDDRLKNSFTWWKNRSLNSMGNAGFTTQPVDILFNELGGLVNSNLPYNPVSFSKIDIKYVDMSSIPQPPSFQNWIGQEWQSIKVYMNPVPTIADFYLLDVYKNGTLVNTYEYSTYGGGQSETVLPLLLNAFGTNDEYTFKIRGVKGGYDVNLDFRYRLYAKYLKTDNTIGIWQQDSLVSTSVAVGTAFDFNTTAPDMKVLDWFNGTLKEFNLTCYPTRDVETFQIEPLADWYANGETVNITPYVDTKKIQVDRAKLYNEIAFEFAKSKSFMNEAFKEINNRTYGDLKQIFPNHDGGKYSVKLPFETMLFNNFDTVNGNLQVGYCLTKAPDYKDYIPRPVKLYLNTSKVCSFQFNNGFGNSLVSSYVPFGQETVHNTANNSMNFGEEISSLTLNTAEKSLYSTYYQPYLVNLFDPKTRVVTVNCVLPLDILTRLTLDDAILIRDKKYRINDMTTELTSGLVKLVLISDWITKRAKIPQTPPTVIHTGGDIVIPIKPLKGGGWVTINEPIDTPFVSTSPTLPETFSTVSSLTITVPTNESDTIRNQTIKVSYYKSNGELESEEYISISQEKSGFKLLLENGAELLTERLDNILI
jgi:hypothetical protein